MASSSKSIPRPFQRGTAHENEMVVNHAPVYEVLVLTVEMMITIPGRSTEFHDMAGLVIGAGGDNFLLDLCLYVLSLMNILFVATSFGRWFIFLFLNERIHCCKFHALLTVNTTVFQQCHDRRWRFDPFVGESISR